MLLERVSAVDLSRVVDKANYIGHFQQKYYLKSLIIY